MNNFLYRKKMVKPIINTVFIVSSTSGLSSHWTLANTKVDWNKIQINTTVHKPCPKMVMPN